MALNAGIVGLPNVGKSTLFNALTKAGAQAANFPFCTIEPNVGVIPVPDPRLDQLSALVKPQSLVPTALEVVDIAGLVEGASKGEGLGNQFLGNIRSTDAIIHVVRCFEDDNITHVSGRVNPVQDRDIIETELQLKDLDTVEKRMLKMSKTAKSGDKDAKRELSVLDIVKAGLEQGTSVRNIAMSDDDREVTREWFLLTAKPVMYVCNVEEGAAKSGNKFVEEFKQAVAHEDAEVIVVSAAIEADIAALDTEEEQVMFLEDLGLEEPGLHRVIRSAYSLLNLITYFTAGVKEVRAWTVEKGSTAPQAAGVIHTDFERGFIRAEVISFNDFVGLGGEQACKEAGKMKVEGKEYVVMDGDVMHFRFNV